MTEEAFITHCTRGIRIAQRGHEVIDPILEILGNAVADMTEHGKPEDAQMAKELEAHRTALSEWVQDVAELIVDLTHDYLERQ